VQALDEPVAQTLPERTAEVIRQKILGLAPGYRPADRLYPSRVAADVGVSVTPIREALKVLAVNGFVVFSPRRGVRVVNPSERELRDLMAVQEGLELLALRFAGQSGRQAAVGELQGNVEANNAALERGDIGECRSLSSEFHRRLVAQSLNGPLINLYGSLLNQTRILDLYYPRALADVQAAAEEHRAIVVALRKGFAPAQDRLTAHWQGTLRRFGQTYRRIGVEAGERSGRRLARSAEAVREPVVSSS
jgi:DNA-binding GntR family transcriptional regulator